MQCQDELATIPQTLGFEDFVRTTEASVPNCTFGSLRENGIYGHQPNRAEITAMLYCSGVSDPFGPATQSVGFVVNGDFSNETSVVRENRALSTDRSDWRRGREIFGIEAIQIEGVRIPLGTVVLASGREALPLPDGDLSGIEFVRRSQYILVGSVQGDCPVEPGEGNIQRDACLVFMTVECETFPEDYISHIFLDTVEERLPSRFDNISPDSTSCSLFSVELIWGRNFRSQ